MSRVHENLHEEAERLKDDSVSFSHEIRLSYIILAVIFLLAVTAPPVLLVQYFLYRQDLPVITLIFGILLLWRRRLLQRGKPSTPTVTPQLSWIIGALAVLLVFAFCWAGRHLVMWDYPFSRDEQLALFASETISSGRLHGLIAEPWLSVRAALNQTFMATQTNANVWAPVYLPGNALLHMVVEKVGPAGLTGPLLCAAGVVATWGVARQLWPNQGDLHLVALLLFVLSAQNLALGMTSYAMSAHLTLNMSWLWLFLKNRPWSHTAALLVGMLATGLHQLPFHPLFAAPILATLLWDRRWAVAGFYLVGYALIGLFWTHYLTLPGLATPSGLASELGTQRAASMASGAFALSLNYLHLTAAGIVRFFSWQHILLLPLMIIGGRAAWQSRDPIQIALVLSFLLMIVVRLLMRPYQGHGWGYRYFHGLIGVACLTATFGWAKLRDAGLADWSQLRLASLLTLGLVIPWLLFQAHLMVQPYANLSKRFDELHTMALIIADKGAPFAKDLVINRPDLSNRPVRLMASELHGDDLTRLCQRGSLTYVSASDLAGINDLFGLAASPSVEEDKRLLNHAPPGCVRAFSR
ncbi:MAG: hypothetical protein KKD64_08515 [Alphaproteobacteria bacterium]|nr:hypothetical protein [Alphaproteobacteria bacterium]MBU0794679.1 hypothetical protein [Alphaproteobacteria bacterium]MBU0874350.1 hypothetical protein [Alphaproteobacteria bacterium]MBU1769682.1 hypothetical protein [Alphaproteobacteria bacterium]